MDSVPPYPDEIPDTPADLPDECARIAYAAALQARGQSGITEAQTVSSAIMGSLASAIDEGMVEAETVANQISALMTGAVTQILKVVKGQQTKLINTLTDTIIGSLSEANKVAQEIVKIAGDNNLPMRSPFDVLTSQGQPKPGQPILRPTPGRFGATSQVPYPDLSAPFFAPFPPGDNPLLPANAQAARAVGGIVNEQSPVQGLAALLQAQTAGGAAQVGQALQAGMPLVAPLSLPETAQAFASVFNQLNAAVSEVAEQCPAAQLGSLYQAIAAAQQQAQSLYAPILEMLRQAPTPEAISEALSARAPQVPVDLDQPLAFLFGEASARWHAPARAFMFPALEPFFQGLTLADIEAQYGQSPVGDTR